MQSSTEEPASDGHDRGGKDFTHGRLFGGPAFEGDFAGVIALGKDAEQTVVIQDQQRADVFVGHELDGFEDGGLGMDGPELRGFVAEDGTNGAGDVHRVPPG